MKTTKHFIYKLIDLITNEIRYIGQAKFIKRFEKTNIYSL